MSSVIMIICPVCSKGFALTDDTGIIKDPIIHISKDEHRFQFKNRKILMENLLRLSNEEEIPYEENGEKEAEENPFAVKCFLCGRTSHASCICGMCNVVLCEDCYKDHDDLIIDIYPDSYADGYEEKVI